MIPLRVLGIGSPLGADRTGWVVAEQLRQRLKGRHATSALRIDICDRPGAALVPHLQDAEAVILIDAMLAGLPPCSLKQLNLDEIQQQHTLASSHGFGVAEALSLAQSLRALPPRFMIFGIEVGGLGEPPPLERLEPAITRLEEAVMGLLGPFCG